MCVGPLAAGAAFVLASRRGPAPSLDGLQPLLAARRFDDVERRLSEYLRRAPEKPQANMLMAQVAPRRVTTRSRDLALDHLARIQAAQPRHAGDGPAQRGQGILGPRPERSGRGSLEGARCGSSHASPRRLGSCSGSIMSRAAVRTLIGSAMALHAIEPDPRDRAQLLLELVRQDAQPIGLDSLIATLEPLVPMPSGGSSHGHRTGPGPGPQQPTRRRPGDPA